MTENKSNAMTPERHLSEAERRYWEAQLAEAEARIEIIEAAKNVERTAIVVWLRDPARGDLLPGYLANFIERGEHHPAADDD